MSGFKDIAKNGWHPKGKDGGKESWRSENKGINTVAGWVGKGKSSNEAAYEHQSTPLSSLKDPASFAPPPKRIGYHGASAASIGSSSIPAESSRLGAPVPGSARQRQQEVQEVRAREEEANRPPPGPFRADTTGLNTANLPKPPVFRPGQAASPSPTMTAKPKLSLPPRLPPRQNEYPDAHTAAPPPPYSETAQDSPTSQGQINYGALNRLGGAGVSVPGFNIGRNASPPVPPRQNSSSAPIQATETNRAPQMNELQSRFARMPMPSAQVPKTGTTWAEKQAALKTAGSLRGDPSKVTLSDARSAASTANNFRQRHGEQAAAGWRTASGLNQKYGITDKLNGVASSSAAPPPPQSPTHDGVGKKPPPPPPPKRRELTTGESPPIPLGSKPKF